jgi:hypothetical protein
MHAEGHRQETQQWANSLDGPGRDSAAVRSRSDGHVTLSRLLVLETWCGDTHVFRVGATCIWLNLQVGSA